MGMGKLPYCNTSGWDIDVKWNRVFYSTKENDQTMNMVWWNKTLFLLSF
jgi:hypothetical protein